MEKRELQLGFNDLLPIGITLGVTGLGIAYLAQATGDAQDDMTANTYEYNITNNGLVGMNNLSARFGTIGTVAAAAVIIGVVVTFLAFSRR